MRRGVDGVCGRSSAASARRTPEDLMSRGHYIMSCPPYIPFPAALAGTKMVAPRTDELGIQSVVGVGLERG